MGIIFKEPGSFDEISDALAKSIQEEIDAEIMYNTLKRSSPDWIEVLVPSSSADIVLREWINNTIPDAQFFTYGRRWLFKEAHNAEVFALKWA